MSPTEIKPLFLNVQNGHKIKYNKIKYPVAGLIRCWGSLRHKQFAASLNEQTKQTAVLPPLVCVGVAVTHFQTRGIIGLEEKECRTVSMSSAARGTTENSWYLRALSGMSPVTLAQIGKRCERR